MDTEFQIDEYHLVIRLAQVRDYYKSHLPLLAQLSPTTNQVKIEDYQKLIENQGFDTASKQNSGILIYVIEDLLTHQLVASGTLLVERKIIHQIGLVGHIEDIVVDKKYRSLKLGQKLVDKLVEKAGQFCCYKVILNCYERLSGFYGKIGFATTGIEMRQDIIQRF